MAQCVDISHVGQGYLPLAFFQQFAGQGGTDVIVKAGGADDGLYQDPAHDQHCAYARQCGLNVGHYWFNGPYDAASCAQLFLQYANPQPGDTMWFDVEVEGSMQAWEPSDVLEGANELAALGQPMPGVYLNQAEIQAGGWGGVAQQCPLWEAAYIQGPPDTGPWGAYVWWQDTDAYQVGSWSVDGSVPGTASPSAAKPSSPIESEDGMRFLTFPDWGGQCYVCGWGFIQYIGTPSQLSALLNIQYGDGNLSHLVTVLASQAQDVLDGLGLGNITAAQLEQLPANPPEIFLSGMLNQFLPSAVSATLSADQIQSIVTGVAAAQKPIEITGTITAEGKES